MKRNILFLCLVLIIFSCKHRNAIPDVDYRFFEPWQLAYIPYQLNDTISFTNETNGDVLHYKCTKYDKYMSTDGSTIECPTKDPCYVISEEILQVRLECIENNALSLNIYYAASRAHLDFIFNNTTNGEELSSRVVRDSSCGLASTVYAGAPIPDVECVGTVFVNGKNYLTVAKLLDLREWNSNFDTLYYNKPNGFIRFCLSSGDKWNRN